MTRRLPPLYALRAFEAAARHASFTRAGEELAITQSAVSRHACYCPGCATASMRWNGLAPPCVWTTPPCA